MQRAADGSIFDPDYLPAAAVLADLTFDLPIEAGRGPAWYPDSAACF
jgi:hypothetical protein